MAVVFAGGLSGLSACVASLNVGDTHVGQKELYKTGNPDFDEFFEEVNAVQVKAQGMDEDAKKARAPLGGHLGAGDASVDDLLDKLKDRAEDLAQGKAKVHFALEGLDEQGKPAAGKPLEVKSQAKGRPVPKEANDFASAVEGMARAEGQVWEKYSPLADKCHRMGDKAAALDESVDANFVSKEKRQEVRKELGASRIVLKDIGERGDRVVADALKFLRETGEGFVAAASAEPKKKEKKGKPARAAAPAPKPKEPPREAPHPKEAASHPAPPPKEPVSRPSPPPKPAREERPEAAEPKPAAAPAPPPARELKPAAGPAPADFNP
jgi:hypothetical protein